MFSDINIQTHGRHNCPCPWPPDTVVKTKYNPIISQDIIKATLYLCTFSLAIQTATLDYSTLCFAIRSHSNASISICCTLSLSFLAASSCQSNKPFPHHWCYCTTTRAWVFVQPPKELTSLIGVLQQNSYHINGGQLRRFTSSNTKLLQDQMDMIRIDD